MEVIDDSTEMCGMFEVVCVVCPSAFETWHNPVCYECGLLLVHATLVLSLNLNAY